MEANIILGCVFGDEGKGITTDFLCKNNPLTTIVVRFSGGQQAGHNVKIGDVNHIHFHHFTIMVADFYMVAD